MCDIGGACGSSGHCKGCGEWRNLGRGDYCKECLEKMKTSTAKDQWVDRQGSLFEVQKADVERLLGEAERPKRPEWLWEGIYGKYCHMSHRGNSLSEVRTYIEHLEQANTDALAVLENMEEETVILDKREVLEQQIWEGTAKPKAPAVEPRQHEPHYYDAQGDTFCKVCGQRMSIDVMLDPPRPTEFCPGPPAEEHDPSPFAWEYPKCKAYGDSIDGPKPPVCPNCGARMDGPAEEPKLDLDSENFVDAMIDAQGGFDDEEPKEES